MVNTLTERYVWSRPIEFILSTVGYCVGLSNLWRFPYLCMRNGGGAFLIPYLTFLILCGIPLFFMELCMGQFSGLSPLKLWNICPLFKGLGWGMMIVNTIVSTYFIMAATWTLFYLGVSFARDVPWKTCDNDWNTPNCVDIGQNGSLLSNGMLRSENLSHLKSQAEEYWSHRVLGLSSGIGDLGTIRWELATCLLVAWVVIFLCLVKGIKSSGKVVYVTATMPYLLLTVLLIRGATLPGSLEGVKFYIIPDFSKLANFNVWTEACIQVFYTLGIAWGCLITMASYNRFHKNCLWDSIVICLVCGGTSLYAGFAIFSVLGFMANTAGIPIEHVVSQGPGLIFVAYPIGISQLPASPIWAVCFFTMVLTLIVDGQFGMVETVISGLADEYPNFIGKRRVYVLAGFCCVLFLLGLPLVTNGGMYLFQVLDWYSGTFSVVVIGFGECIFVGYVYGIGRFYDDLTVMLKRRPSKMWAVMWCGVIPALLLIMLCVCAYQMAPPTYGDYIYPDWAISMGWVLGIASIIPMPCVAVYRLATLSGSIGERLSVAFRPDRWTPQDKTYQSVCVDNTYTSWKERMTISSRGFNLDMSIDRFKGNLDLELKEEGEKLTNTA